MKGLYYRKLTFIYETVTMPELLTPDDVAEELNCTPQWVTALLRRGDIRGQKLNERQWVITREDLDTYIAELEAKKATVPSPDPRE